MFSLTAEDARQCNQLVEGMPYILDHCLKVLYDSGAAHSCISSMSAAKLELLTVDLKYELKIVSPFLKTSITNKIVENVP